LNQNQGKLLLFALRGVGCLLLIGGVLTLLYAWLPPEDAIMYPSKARGVVFLGLWLVMFGGGILNFLKDA